MAKYHAIHDHWAGVIKRHLEEKFEVVFRVAILADPQNYRVDLCIAVPLPSGDVFVLKEAHETLEDNSITYLRPETVASIGLLLG